MKVGFIGRADFAGLGNLSYDFCRFMEPDKIMIVLIADYKYNLKRFKNPIAIKGIPSDEEIREFLKGLDILYCIETPYNLNTFIIAKEMGVKTVMSIDYEWFEKVSPDLILSPSVWHFDDIQENKEYLPYPIDTEVLPFKLRTKAKKFIHIAGNGRAWNDRNGTKTLIEAMKSIKSDIELVIKVQGSQRLDLGQIDGRISVDYCDFENYWEIWEDADVYVSPRKYAGPSLPLNEAMSLGMAVIMTDMDPQNKFLPNGLLVKTKSMSKLIIKREIEVAEIDPIDLARKIDEIAGRDISQYSRISGEIAREWSWKKLKPTFKKIFENLC